MRVLLIDDHALFREGLALLLAPLAPELDVLDAGSCEEAQALLQTLSRTLEASLTPPLTAHWAGLAAHASELHRAEPDSDGGAEQVLALPPAPLSFAPVDLVVMDLGLPGMSGLDGIAWLHQQHPDVPVVALSSSDDRPTVERALMAGAMGFIPKSANSAVMVNALRLALAGEVYLPPSVFLPSTKRPAAANNHAVAEGLLPVPLPERAAAAAPVAALPANARAPAGLAHPRGFATPEDLGLSHRQAQVLQRLLQGKPTKIICRELVLAEGTVKAHISASLRALNVTNRVQAVIAAARLNLRFSA